MSSKASPGDYLRDLFSMEGKTILIAGASSGIGSHIAGAMAKAGGNVVLGARRLDRIRERAAEIQEQTGRRAHAVELDVTDQKSIEAAFSEAASVFDVPTVVCNNAGLARPGWAVSTTEEDWDVTMDTNLKGMWRVATVAVNRMRDVGKPGSIINTASILGLGVAPSQMTYSVSKAAVVQMTRALAIEFGRFGVRVNAICPGYFKTEINDQFLETDYGKQMLAATPARRHGNLEELSSAFLMLAGDGATFVSGVALPVDAGHNAVLV